MSHRLRILRCVRSSRGPVPAATFQISGLVIVQRSGNVTVSRVALLGVWQSARRLRASARKRNGGRFERGRLFRGFEGKFAAEDLILASRRRPARPRRPVSRARSPELASDNAASRRALRKLG